MPRRLGHSAASRLRNETLPPLTDLFVHMAHGLLSVSAREWINEVKMELARGIAHVSYPGGGVFLPARDPYDRQTLIEHVNQRVRAKGRVQVLIDSHRWMVQPNSLPLASACAACGQVAETACYSACGYGAPYCVPCALGGATRVDPPQHEEWRQVG